MSPIQTVTHLRVGTMFSWEILGRNFVGVPTGKRSIKPHHTHLMLADAKEHGWYDTLKNSGKPTIYIVRDGRDVLVSQFYFLRKLKTDFPGFIRGKGNPKSQGHRGDPYPIIQERIRKDPVGSWVEHSQWIEEDWVRSFRYEWIRENQEEFVIQLQALYGLKTLWDKPYVVKSLVGVKPRKGIVGDWRNHFSDEDLDYFWKVAGQRMLGLGYELY